MSRSPLLLLLIAAAGCGAPEASGGHSALTAGPPKPVFHSWKDQNHDATDVGVGANGALYTVDGNPNYSADVNMLGDDGPVWQFVPGVPGGPSDYWVPTLAFALRITVTADGMPWIVQKSGDIFEGGPGNQWTKRPGLAHDIASGHGAVFMIANDAQDGSVLKWIPSLGRWLGIPGAAGKTIAVDALGNPWVVSSQGTIYRRVSDQWLTMPGSAIDIGAGADGAVWIIDGDGHCDWWNDVTGSWEPYPDPPRGRFDPLHGIAIAVGPDGYPWVIERGGNSFEFPLYHMQ
jgi:hypothetical protein